MKTTFILLTTLIVLFSHRSIAQDLKTMQLDNKLSILNDRAFFNFPDSAKNIARPVDIMSTDHNINKETRIIYDNGSKRLVFFAQELYTFGGDDLYELVSKEQDPENTYLRKVLTKEQAVLSILTTPTTFDSLNPGIFINSLMVKTQDNTLFRIDAYINPAAYPLKDDYIALTERIFSSLTVGNRTNPLKARKEKVNIFGTEKSFEIEIPENYAVTVDQKYDFQVIKFQKYVNFGDTNWINLTIYTGHHPSFFSSDYGFDEPQKTEQSEFLEEKVKWLYYEDQKKSIYLKEQKIPCDAIEEELIVHIAMISNSPQSIAELTTIIGQIQLNK